MIVLQIRAQTVFSVPMVLTTFFVIVQQVQNGLAKIAAPIPSVPRLTHAILMEPSNASCSCETVASTSSVQTYVWDGPTCSYKDFCPALACPSHSTCEGSQTAGDCICDAGYSPAYPASNACQTFACDGYCKNSGTCSFNTVTATPECTCSGDFFGATCEKTVCDGYNCNDGTCGKDSGTGLASCDCNVGFSGDLCEVLKQCTCPNGTGMTGASCTTHGSQSCESCDADFTDVGGACVMRQCTCPNGTGMTGAGCTTHGSQSCASCDAEFTDVAGACVMRQCTCPNGTGMMGAGCTTHGSLECQSCAPGYSGATCGTYACTGHCQNAGTCSINASGDASYNCNDGTCSIIGGQTACTCNAGFTGTLCDETDYCVGNSCTSDSTCVIQGSGYYCDCDDGFVGVLCDVSTTQAPVTKATTVATEAPVETTTAASFVVEISLMLVLFSSLIM